MHEDHVFSWLCIGTHDGCIHLQSKPHVLLLAGRQWLIRFSRDSLGLQRPVWKIKATPRVVYFSYDPLLFLELQKQTGVQSRIWSILALLLPLGGRTKDATIHGAVGIFTVLDWEEAYYTIHDAWTWVKATQGMHPFDEIASSFQTLLEMRVSSKRSKTRKSYLKPQLFQISKMVLF